MPNYLVQAAYTPEGWATLVKNPQDRQKAVQPVVKELGGKVLNMFFAFGEYDVIALIEMPDDNAAAAFAVAAAAGGAVKAVKTTPLITVEDSLKIMKKAGQVGYQPPG